MPFVQVLSLSVNSIKSLADFAYCKNLQELYLRDNKVSDLSQLMHLQDLPNLKKLWLSGNPCSEAANYRMIVLRILPNLEMLDNIPVTNEEVAIAESIDFEVDEETGEITTPGQLQQHPVHHVQHRSSSSKQGSDYTADDEAEEDQLQQQPAAAVVNPVHHHHHNQHQQHVPPNRQYSTPEPLHGSSAAAAGAAVVTPASQKVQNQRFRDYDTETRVRQPPAHLVTPVQTANMVRSASIADYTGFSGDSLTPSNGSAKSGSGGTAATGAGMVQQQRLLPKGGRNRVSKEENYKLV
jgi:hypothetical protein